MLLVLLACISIPIALRFGNAIGSILFALCRGLRMRTEDNIRQAFGNSLNPGQVEGLSRSTFQVLGRNVAEVASLSRRPFERLQVVNPEILREAYARGKGVVLVSAHMGCFSRMVAVPRLLGMKGAAIMKRQRNSMLLDWARVFLKRRFDLDVILKTDAVDQVQEHLKSGSLVGFFADQHPRTGGFPTQFFGRPVEVAPGPAIYAKRYHAPMVVLTCVSQPDGSHAVRCDGPVDPVGSLLDMTRRWMAIIEARIREHPEQWMWMHRRWR
ncbi:MAG TPA: lysophospholipid acyltransferase family protein [Planctomycetota bacterium]|nr:lysophospholipid acyltransferase family protein [Planctomycetota bacterium]